MLIRFVAIVIAPCASACVKLRMSCSSLTIDSCVHSYHEYSVIWEPFIGEELQCNWETANPHDPYAVSVLKQWQIVGHVPRNIFSQYF